MVGGAEVSAVTSMHAVIFLLVDLDFIGKVTYELILELWIAFICVDIPDFKLVFKEVLNKKLQRVFADKNCKVFVMSQT